MPIILIKILAEAINFVCQAEDFLPITAPPSCDHVSGEHQSLITWEWETYNHITANLALQVLL